MLCSCVVLLFKHVAGMRTLQVIGYIVVHCKLKYSWGIEQVSILTK